MRNNIQLIVYSINGKYITVGLLIHFPDSQALIMCKDLFKPRNVIIAKRSAKHTYRFPSDTLFLSPSFSWDVVHLALFAISFNQCPKGQLLTD